ncbi:MAG: nucleoside:proton symporter [Gammaproteobacteria bacterium]|nr:nucleoside:proton symporter [Gammaproteobacteria bacterium]MCP5135808.1 nucleoside:proton symporter [Gammaproteobacteria bacterium]
MQSLLGIVVLTALAWALSENRRFVKPAVVVAGLGLQFAIALLLLTLPGAQNLFHALNDSLLALQDATRSGTRFVFGYLGGGDLPFDPSNPANTFILAFQVLPLILVMSALSALLFHWRVLPAIVRGFAWILERSMRIGGPLGLGTAANVFMGMVESPLLVRPYLAHMSRADLFALMTAGMSTIAGTMLALYASVLGGVIDNAVGHILTASLISAPAALMFARLLVPADTHGSEQSADIELPFHSSMDAITYGTTEGLKLLAQIIAMLLVLIALVALANQLLGAVEIGDAPLSLQRLFGWLLAPLAWLIGIPWAEADIAGRLLGTKTVLNEMLAYLDMAALPRDTLSEHSRLILTYALCGFANFGSLGILIGGMGAMAPERRAEIVALGPKSILSGTLATCLTGAVAGLIL